MKKTPALDVAAAPPIGAAEVLDYLRRHPDFLVDHPEALTSQAPPSRFRAGGVLDLQQFMLQRLRDEAEALRADRDAIIDASRTLHSAQGRAHGAVLALLAATTFEHFIEILGTELAGFLDLDVVTLCVEAPESPTGALRWRGVRLIAGGAVDRLIEPDHELALAVGIRGEPAIFGAGAGLVRSQALIRLKLRDKGPKAMLALGSRRAEYFQSGQSTELLRFLGRIVQLCLRTWLDLPR